MEIHSFRTPGLGDQTYLLEHEGKAILVDPQRDISRFLDEAAARDLELRFVLETHLHNDYVSGAEQAALRTGAELVLPAAAAAAYRYTPAFHLEELKGEGGLSIRPLHTPGHTPEHTSYLILLDGREVAVFSGGSLLAGSAGRPDLLGPERAETAHLGNEVGMVRRADLRRRVGQCRMPRAVQAGGVANVKCNEHGTRGVHGDPPARPACVVHPIASLARRTTPVYSSR